MSKPKDLSIETLRGLAILLVVAGYILSDDLVSAQGSIFTSALRFMHFCLTPIRMPLFTVISAYLYAESPVTRETFKKMMTGKSRRLMVPFIFMTALQYTFFLSIPASNHPPPDHFYMVYIYPYEQLWFIFSIFQIFVIVGFLDSREALGTFKKWVAVLAIALFLHLTFKMTRLFSVSGINYLFPFFLAGYGLRRYSKELFSKSMINYYIVVAVLSYSLFIFLYVRNITDISPMVFRVTGLFIAFSAVPLILYFRRPWQPLARIGYYAFGIYLFNKIGTALAREVCQKMNFDQTEVLFLIYLSAGVIFSVLLEKFVLRKFSFTRRLILGLSDKIRPAAPLPAYSTINTQLPKGVSHASHSQTLQKEPVEG